MYDARGVVGVQGGETGGLAVLDQKAYASWDDHTLSDVDDVDVDVVVHL
jgi:hypothetical protein